MCTVTGRRACKCPQLGRCAFLLELVANGCVSSIILPEVDAMTYPFAAPLPFAMGLPFLWGALPLAGLLYVRM